MAHFCWDVLLRALGSKEAGTMNQPRNASIVASVLLSGGAFVASLTLMGCGDTSANPPYNKELAKTSAKYKELHPEEFPSPKTQKVKVAKTRRGG